MEVKEMIGITETVGETKVIGQSEGESYWQPVPANGFVRNILNDKAVNSSAKFSLSVQTVAPGCFIREHTHSANEEIVYIASGTGSIKLDGTDVVPVSSGSAVFLGANRKHRWNNPGPNPLVLVLFFCPGGLDEFHKEIGRPKTAGKDAPAPFPRPDNIAEIEARTVFGWTDLNPALQK
jgi:quercetin dioxygenase-like cupin family protein